MLLKALLIAVFILMLPVRFVFAQEAKRSVGEMTPCTVKVKGEKVDALCGSIEVPENRNDPNSRTITLPVTQILATGDNPAEPIFHMTGGPGMSNMKFQPPLSLLENHDVVLVGYRGVDGSVTLDCPEWGEAAKGVGNDLFSEASIANMENAMTACNERLRNEGIDLAGYTIPEVVADFEAVRETLGYGRINLLSESYGTRIAQIYAQMVPDSIHRSVMIGVNPPGHFIWEPEIVDAQLAQYGALCAADANCAARTDDLVAVMRAVNQNMPTRWMGMPINAGKVKSVAFALFFHPQTAVYVFDAYLAASEGDASGLALMTFAYDNVIPKMGVWGEFFAKGYSADFDPNRDYSQLDAPDSVMGSPMAQLIWATSSVWSMPTIDEAYRQVQPTAVETLLVSGDIDFSTPAEYATDELLPALENGHQVILQNMGHTNDFWNAQPAASEQLLNTYYATGEVDDSGYVEQEINFATGLLNLPNIAKGLVVLPVILTLGLVGLGAFIVKRIRRRRSA